MLVEKTLCVSHRSHQASAVDWGFTETRKRGEGRDHWGQGHLSWNSDLPVSPAAQGDHVGRAWGIDTPT